MEEGGIRDMGCKHETNKGDISDLVPISLNILSLRFL